MSERGWDIVAIPYRGIFSERRADRMNDPDAPKCGACGRRHWRGLTCGTGPAWRAKDE